MVPVTDSGGRGIFVTGTDTGVGKSLVSAALARFLVRQGIKVGVMKPVQRLWDRTANYYAGLPVATRLLN